MNKHLAAIVLIAHAIGLLVLSIFCFMGCLYLLKDHAPYSIALAFLAILIPFILVYWMSEAKEREVNKGFTFSEAIGWLLYLIFVVVTLLPVSHYFNVEHTLKAQLQDKGKVRLAVLEQIISDYEADMRAYNAQLNKEITALISSHEYERNAQVLLDTLRNYGVQASSIREIPSGKKRMLAHHLAITTNALGSLKEANKRFSDRQTLILNTWNYPNIHTVFKDIDDRLEATVQRLQVWCCDHSAPKWRAHSFHFALPPRQDDLLSDPERLCHMSGFSLRPPLIVALPLYLFILLPYLATARMGRIYPKWRPYDGGIDM